MDLLHRRTPSVPVASTALAPEAALVPAAPQVLSEDATCRVAPRLSSSAASFVSRLSIASAPIPIASSALCFALGASTAVSTPSSAALAFSSPLPFASIAVATVPLAVVTAPIGVATDLVADTTIAGGARQCQ